MTKTDARRALIIGLAGQDGSYLAELLLEKGYAVFGTIRRRSPDALARVAHILDRVALADGDLTSQASVNALIQSVAPDEVYNFAAQSFVPASWDQPVHTGEITALGVARLLEALRRHKPDARFYQASSSELFGLARETPQSETTPFHPRSPYGAAKAYGHNLTVNYRESLGLYACSGICFNHESPRRGLEFVTRKITHRVAEIELGLAQELKLGSLETRRDWGFAGDYVKAMWLMLQQERADDYVVSTGQPHSVQDFVEAAFEVVGRDWRRHTVVDPALVRPPEANVLTGDSSKIRRELGWAPTVDFRSLVRMMVESDLRLLRQAPDRDPRPASAVPAVVN